MALTQTPEDGFKVSNTPSDGKFLQYKDDTDKLTWATVNTDVVSDTTPQLGGNLDINGSNLITNSSASDPIWLKGSNAQDIRLEPGPTDGMVVVGDAGDPGVITSAGAHDLVLRTDDTATDFASITLTDGSNGNITVAPHGTGNVKLDSATVQVGDNNTDVAITTQGTGDLLLSTNSNTNSGTIEIEDGANNDIVITPNGTGDVKIDGLKYPQADGSAGQFLKTDGNAQLSFAAVTEYDDSQVQQNIAMLGFKVAANGSLARYNLVDQVIDEYNDASGVDASASTNEKLASGAYYGEITTTGPPTISHDADSTGTDGDYTWYKWTDTSSTGSYSQNVAQNMEWLIVAGGGGGGYAQATNEAGSGGGAGGYRAGTAVPIAASTTYTVTVGAGGGGGGYHSRGASGGNSSISGSGLTTITADGGSGGIKYGEGMTTISGGSSGGGSEEKPSSAALTITQLTAYGESHSVQGHIGGPQADNNNAGGGGGAGAAGTTHNSGNGGDGGDGRQNDITGTNTWYAGGGGAGGSSNGGDGGQGGGGAGKTSGASNAGTDGLGGGGGSTWASGSSYDGGQGGSGVVILRRVTNVTTTQDGGDLTLVSQTTAASANPTKGDLVTLIENANGAATVNTDIKGYISRDGGTNWTQGTLVDEGSWGTNKKILAFHNLDISGQPAAANMRYKITTHNQANGSKVTKVHATSLAWA